jgi:AbrB family looped-hinge helix DNA binding protein
MSSKGQVTIPAAIRAGLGMDTGDRLEFIEVALGRYELVVATQSVTALKGVVGKPSAPVTIEAMNAAIAASGASAK